MKNKITLVKLIIFILSDGYDIHILFLCENEIVVILRNKLYTELL